MRPQRVDGAREQQRDQRVDQGVAARSVTVPTMRRRMGPSASPQKIWATRRSTKPRSGWSPVVVCSARSSRDKVLASVHGKRDPGYKHAAGPG